MTRQMADDEVLRVLRQAATVIDEERCPISAAITHVIAVQSRAERAESALEALRGHVAGLVKLASRHEGHDPQLRDALLAIKERMG